MRKSIMAVADEEETEINLTPMLDVVFIMLIFFIVTASFIKEAGIDVDRPLAAHLVAKPKANILVAISADNEIWIDNKSIDFRAVKVEFERLLSENPEGSVVIQADKDAYTETVVLVADAARQANIMRVSISGKAKD
ncbi:MAG: biopolymer transporter ExbD [Gammaproteobacteria bacterium]|nr:biopolymer transporter ExbD [Gammaproteobacteria bacterium]MCP4090546.1 biopolymer transporter ExbD [Gammaproteobacteria bacterium]MCP4276589.1 biopolymer transporter ExbD [Gammaproteobacteria bacterium]MCP4831345.1 biopolymer transporter ExbD [Gammaproteobacteria bacterium]MCP4928723.1 biopolymer transporter ExbD [Gammaproteobacteria bacterium]